MQEEAADGGAPGRMMTPGEAEERAGLGSNKNWKKTLQVGKPHPLCILRGSARDLRVLCNVHGVRHRRCLALR